MLLKQAYIFYFVMCYATLRMAHGTSGVGIVVMPDASTCACTCQCVLAGEAPLEAPHDYLNHMDDILEIEGPVALPVVSASDGEVMAISPIAAEVLKSLEAPPSMVTEHLVNLYEFLVESAASTGDLVSQRVAELARGMTVSAYTWTLLYVMVQGRPENVVGEALPREEKPKEEI
eukprot:318048_1